ncbi:MAG: hypothetical protein WC967_15240 [Balneolaceae bacterium]
MSKKVLRFEKVDIKKMPGLNHGIKAYEGLSPHINIIAGPNASGKSSTARAIQQLMSQENVGNITAEGSFSIEEESWISHLDPSFIKTQKNGIDAELKGVPSNEEQSRYMLSLHELIKKDDKDLAESILKDAIGGYDIDAAKDKLGYSIIRKPKNVKEFREFESARKTVREISEEQRDLRAKQDQLETLLKQKEKAEKAEELVKFYKLVEDFKIRQASLKALEDELSTFSDKMKYVKEDDYKNLDAFLKEIQDKSASLERVKSEISRFETELTQINLPENGVDSLDVKYVGNEIDRLKELESSIYEAENEIARVDSELKDLSKKLGLNDGESTFEGLNLEGINLTDEYWQSAFDLFGEINQLEKLIKHLSEKKEEVTTKSETLKAGITALSRWLGTAEDSGKSISSSLLGILIILSIATAAAFYLFGAVGYVGLISIVLLLIYLGYKNKSDKGSASVSVRKSDFEETGLVAPTSWEAEEVAKRVVDLINELEETRQLENIIEQIANNERLLKEKKEEFERFRKEAEKAKEALKIIPGLDGDSLKNYSALYWYLKNVLSWQENRNKINAEDAVVKRAKEQIKDLVGKINPVFGKYGLGTVTSFAEAKAQKEQLEEYREAYNDLVRKLETAKSEKVRTVQDKVRAEGNTQSICDRLEIKPEDIDLVKELVGKLEQYNRVIEQKSNSSAILSEARNSMKSHSIYSELVDEVAVITLDELSHKIKQFAEEAAELTNINNSIVRIETLVRSTEQKHELENALQKEVQALQELEELYKTNANSIIGELLAKQVKAHLGEKNMPEVFVRAKELFKRITKNRYELLVDSTKGDAGFSAMDLRDGVGRSLEELSTGTRIQLIMSVRLAFIEQAEGDISLPILADELLANSDTQRANAIIDALIEISKAGRQIFYFTAQEDEVAKWESKLKNEKDIEHKVYVIEQGDGLHKLELERVQVFAGIQLQKEIQKPNSMSYEAYGEALGVPPVHSIFTPVEQLHIWYLFDDAVLLYSVLKTGIENWGMLKSYFKEGGVLDGLDKNTQNKIEQKAELIAQYLELKQHGNNRPVDRQVLEDSDAVTPTFIDPTAAQLEECDFDPSALIKALENRAVPGFFTNKREELEEYFINNGYIQQSEPFSQDEIHIRLLAYISNTNISTEEAEQVLGRLNK